MPRLHLHEINDPENASVTFGEDEGDLWDKVDTSIHSYALLQDDDGSTIASFQKEV